ncbi:MAG: IS66 family insertion sequence element accessory protein TnpB [Butyrivibrio sp.]|nr:IS66 family insertion sequence element accessory protein TnpB [Butyrivibrio sp.]
MDKSTHEVRLSHWKRIIEESENRPQGISKHQWLIDNNIPEKTYYYWLRKVRAAAYSQMSVNFPVSFPREEVILAEIPGKEIFTDVSKSPAVVIRAKKSTIELSGDLSADTLVKLVKVLVHAV